MRLSPALIFCSLGLAGPAPCQETPSQPVPVVEKEERRDTSAGDVFLQRLESSTTGEEIHALVGEAYQQKDLEALKVCWTFPKASVYFVEAFKIEKSLELKDSIALMMMRSAWHSDEEPGKQPLMKGGVPLAANPCIEIISQYIPEEGLKVGDYASVKRLQRSAYRFELADRLEAKIAGKALEPF